MKNKTFLQSVRCALKGIRAGFRTEKNFKIYLGLAGAALALNLLLDAALWEYCAWVITVSGAFSAEYINTAIERMADQTTTAFSAPIGELKDIAAAAVLVSGIAFFAVEGLILGSKLL